MNRVPRRGSLPVCLCLMLLGSTSVRADPDEAWLHRASLPDGLRPLLVLILDRSSAMAATTEVREPFDPGADYGDGLAADRRCETDRVYWRRGPGPAPDCASQIGLELRPATSARGMHCEAASESLARLGYHVVSRAAQWTPAGAFGYWTAIQADSALAVECRADRGRHGTATGRWYAADGQAGPWSDRMDAEIEWDRSPHADPYIFYAGNYLNYLQSGGRSRRWTLAELAAERLAAIGATDELDVAIVLTGSDDGGFIALAPTPAAVAAARLPELLRAAPDGAAPLAETLSEAAAWLAGAEVRFGHDEQADPDAFIDATAGRYRSPFTHACRPVTLGFLTAGCDPDCLVRLADWIGSADLRNDLPGRQSAAIGQVGRFEDPLAFVDLIARGHQQDAAVPAGPRLSAAGLARAGVASHAPSVIFGLSAPRVGLRWHGNAFRYGLQAAPSPLAPPVIVDRDGEPAIDTVNALPRSASRSLWSDAPDVSLLVGGAAGRLPVAAARQLYSDIHSDRLNDPANRLEPGNPRLQRGYFGLQEADAETPDSLVDWLAGQRVLGDPGPQPPLVVDYLDSGLQVAYVATQDGLLHAIDTADGTELWAWMPLALLPRLVELMRDRPTTLRDHGIDGPLVLHRHDPDGDGRIDPAAGEYLLLLVALGRGGNGYSALDISAPFDPRILWTRSLPAAQPVESWAAPVVARLAIDGVPQNDGRWVVLLAGGYARDFDSAAAQPGGAGGDLFLVDAITGEIMWRASGTNGPDVDLVVPGLDASLPSAPRVLDRDGDGRLDQAFVLDVLGRVWRFDFADGRRATEVASARQLARFGGGARRFFASPDVSLVRRDGRLRMAIAAGSGWLSRPRDTAIEDRVYVIFEADSGAPNVLEDGDLHDATESVPVPLSASGWYLRLDRHGAGEKTVGSTVTFDHALRFQTYQPLPEDAEALCGPPRNLNRLYARDIRSALPLSRVADSEEDEPVELTDTGLPVALRFAFPGGQDALCAGCRPRPFAIAGATSFDVAYAGDPVRTSWRRMPPPDSR